QNVTFLGHIDNRKMLNDLFRAHDIFCFASLSEGSPRVVLEAMANGLNVVTTRVGSLPIVFEDEKDIIFANFNDEIDFCNKIIKILVNKENGYILRFNAFQKVRSYNIHNFLKDIFDEN